PNVPNLNLSKVLKQTEGNVHELMQEVSIVSARSAINEQSLVDGEWSDEESILSSAHDKKTALLRHQKHVTDTETVHSQVNTHKSKTNEERMAQANDDSWDDDSVPLSSPRYKGITNSRTQLTSVDEENVGDKTDQNERQDGSSCQAIINNKPPVITSEDERKRILQELSMSDIEDISDPDFDDDNCMSGLNSEPVQKVEKSGGEKKPEAGNDSDWDSTSEGSSWEDDDEGHSVHEDDQTTVISATENSPNIKLQVYVSQRIILFLPLQHSVFYHSFPKIKKNVVITSSNKRSEENECVPSNLDPAQFEIEEYTSDSGGIFIRLSGCRKNEPCQGMSTYHRKSSAGYGSGDREEILEVGASGAQAKSNNSTRTVRISECSTVKGAEEAHSIVQDVANLYDKVLPLYLKVKRKEKLAASTLIHIKKNKQVSITGSVTD
ncbi:hypothetical protein LSH36_488g00007, partial [Paralvinella palmiformis]